MTTVPGPAEDATQQSNPARRGGPTEGERIAVESPEGVPAHPGFKEPAMKGAMIAIAVVLIGAGVAISFLVSPTVGIIVMLLGVLHMLCLNPVVWAMYNRGRERRRIEREQREQREGAEAAATR